MGYPDALSYSPDTWPSGWPGSDGQWQDWAGWCDRPPLRTQVSAPDWGFSNFNVVQITRVLTKVQILTEQPGTEPKHPAL